MVEVLLRLHSGRGRVRARPPPKGLPWVASAPCVRSRSSTLTGPEHLEVRDVPDPHPDPTTSSSRCTRSASRSPTCCSAAASTRSSRSRRSPSAWTSRAPWCPGRVRARPAGGRRRAVRQRRRARRVPQRLGVPATRRALLRGGRGAADELPHRPVRARGARRMQAGETVLVHGAAGGVGTATIQVAKGYGARTIAVVSTDEKGEVAREAGADEVVLLDGFKDAVEALTGGRGCRHRAGRRRRRPLHRLAALPRHAGPAAGRRLRGRPGHPRGQGQPAAAQQRRRPRRRLGGLRDGAAGLHAGAVAGAGADDRGGRGEAADRCDVRASRSFGQALVDMDQRKTLGKSVVRVR